MLAPPRDESELMARAHGLFGQSVESLADSWGVRLGDVASRSKGKVGEAHRARPRRLCRAEGHLGLSVATRRVEDRSGRRQWQAA